MAKKKIVAKKKSPVAKKIFSKKTIKKPIKKTVKSKSTAVKRKKKVLTIPKGYQSITPYLIVDNAVRAIDFYKKAFAAKEVMRLERPDKKIAHAELKLGDAKIMLADQCPEKMKASNLTQNSGKAISIHLYVKSVDEVMKKAVSLGANLVKPVEDMFYGDRSGMLEDPYGHQWMISTHIEDVTPAKLKKRAAEMFSKS